MESLMNRNKLIPDGHLCCPNEFTKKKNVKSKAIVTYDDTKIEATDYEIELSSVKDIPDDCLSQEELNYYLNLDEL